MEVWNHGTPPRYYAMLGIMRSSGGSHSDLEFEVEQIVKAARTKGADALILMDGEDRVEGINLESGRLNGSPTVEAMLIKYR